jgi:hypothetical protein
MVEHGGTVANAYNYPAVTDAVVAVAFADLDVVVIWAGELRANKVTRGGVVSSLLGDEARPLFDERYHPDKARAARAFVLDLARAELP